MTLDNNNNNNNESPRKNAETIGEELYLVHLRRHGHTPPDASDFDHPIPTPSVPTTDDRKRTHSCGEELWEVHLKRSRGMEPDIDVEKKEKVVIKKKVSPPKPHRYFLRMRNVVPKTA